MIRECTEADRVQLMQFLGKKPAENLFLLGDIEIFGFENEIQQVWAQFEDKQLIAVLLRYTTNYIVYSETTYDAKGFAAIINTSSGKFELSGLEPVIREIKPLINGDKIRDVDTYYAKCTELAYAVNERNYDAIQQLMPIDYEENVALIKSIPEFKNSLVSVESYKRAAKNHTGRTYHLKNDIGQIIATASSTAETNNAAMIVAVGTKPEEQKKGYATFIMEKLCSDLIKEGKMLCLFYSNPKAGVIYKRLGFNEIGKWSLLQFQK